MSDPYTYTPDYGRAWRLREPGSLTVLIVPGALGASFDLPEHAERAVACVNACAGQNPVEMRQTLDRLNEWHALTNAGLSLRLGELTAQEVRTVRAVLNAIKGE